MNIDGRLEKTAGTVEITIEEYFELRSKAEASLYVMTQLGRYESRLEDLYGRIYDLEEKLRESR